MEIERFTAADILPAAKLTYTVWGDELLNEAAELKNFIYEAMVRYYCRNFHYSAKLMYENKMQGFLLAGLPTDKAAERLWLEQGMAAFSGRERQLIYEYREYLLYNGSNLHKQAADTDLLLYLFVSMVPGGGSRLLANAVKLAQLSKKSALLLWADETCDYDYYYKRDFTLVEKFNNNKMSLLGEQNTVIFKKKLNKNPNIIRVKSKKYS